MRKSIIITESELTFIKSFISELTKDEIIDFIECLFKERKHHKNKVISYLLSIHKHEKQASKETKVYTLDELINQKDPPPKTWTKEYLKHQMNQLAKEEPEIFDKQLFNNFYKYWCESTGNGKIRLNKEPAFDVKRRLATWKRNNKNESPFKQQQSVNGQQSAYSRAWDSFKSNKQ